MSQAAELIFLIGYRGSGKTTVAQLLSRRLSWGWLDADAVLEDRYHKNISQIFAEEGEEGFRAKESAVLEDLCRLRQYVVATGGGVVLRPENRVLLGQAGLVVWLKAEPGTLWQRLQQDPTTAQRRPNLTQGGLVEIEELLRCRTPLYEACAQLTVDTQGQSPEEVASFIWKHWTSLTRRAGEGTIIE